METPIIKRRNKSSNKIVVRGREGKCLICGRMTRTKNHVWQSPGGKYAIRGGFIHGFCRDKEQRKRDKKDKEDQEEPEKDWDLSEMSK